MTFHLKLNLELRTLITIAIHHVVMHSVARTATVLSELTMVLAPALTVLGEPMAAPAFAVLTEAATVLSPAVAVLAAALPPTAAIGALPMVMRP